MPTHPLRLSLYLIGFSTVGPLASNQKEVYHNCSPSP
jgi:hypothetical protein